MARDAGDLQIELGRRHHIDRAKAQRPPLATPLHHLSTRGLPPRPALAQQPIVVKIDTPQGSTRGISPGYLGQMGKGRDGQAAELYGPGSSDPQAFHRAQRQDSHRFTLIVSFPEHSGVERTGFIQEYLRRMERDLGTRLEWLAANHYDTAHPHTHIVVRGVTEDQEPLYMKKSYFSYGVRERAAELLTQLTGRVREQDRQQEEQRSVTRETTLARELDQLNGRITAGRDPDLWLAQQAAQRTYGHEGLAAHVDRLWQQMQRQDQQRQQESTRSWGRGY